MTRLSTSRNLLLVVAMLALLVIVSWSGVIDRISLAYLNESLVQASLAFAAARALNAIISVLQSVEVSVVLFSISPGQALDPINDLIEHFSTLMKYAIASLFLQQVLLQLVSHSIFKVLVTVLGIAIALCVLFQQQKVFQYLYRPFVFIIFLRFIIVLSVLANGVVDKVFLSEETNKNVAALETYPTRIESLDTTSVLTADTRAAMQADLTEMQAQLLQVEKELYGARALAEEYSAEIDRVLALREAKHDKMGMMQRLNPLHENEELAEINAALRETRSIYEAQEDEVKRLQQQQEGFQAQVGLIEDTLAGKPGGILQSLTQTARDLGTSLFSGSLVTVFGDMLDKLVDTASEVVPLMLKLMAMFVLQTMVFPLLFLYAFIKGFQAIWNRHPRDLAKGGLARFGKEMNA